MGETALERKVESHRPVFASMSPERGGVVEAAALKASASDRPGGRRRIHGNVAVNQFRQAPFACSSASSSSEARRKFLRIDEDGERWRDKGSGVGSIGVCGVGGVEIGGRQSG